MSSSFPSRSGSHGNTVTDARAHGRMKDVIVSVHGNLLAHVESRHGTFPLERLFLSEVLPSRTEKRVKVKEICQYEVTSCPGRVADIASCGDGHLALFTCPFWPSQLSLVNAVRLKGRTVHRVSVTGLPLGEGGPLCPALGHGAGGGLVAAIGVSQGHVKLLRLLESGEGLALQSQRRTPDRSPTLSLTFAPQVSWIMPRVTYVHVCHVVLSSLPHPPPPSPLPLPSHS